jgi:ATP-binding cassette subfamily C (CFTR/MRP) protein 4
MDILDVQVPRGFMQCAACLESVLAVLASIIIANPLVLAAVAPGAILYFMIVKFYRNIARDVQRLEGLSKSPIFIRISETLNGLSTVRAFGWEGILTEELFHDCDVNQAANWIKLKCSAWLALRLELLSCIITTVAALFPTLPFAVKNSNASLVGVALTAGLELSRFIQALTKFGAELEQKFTSVERILEYCNLPSEAATVTPNDKMLEAAWPPAGAIEYRNVTMRYTKRLEPALQQLNFTVSAGEKLGIVGRTGSGKSSIMVSLLRLTECEEGQIVIDGVDTKTMGLEKLRKSLSLIPQEPILFGNTTLRKNLDPFDEHTDEAVQSILKQTQMIDKEALTDGLLTMISEGGSNFSVGERQLLCLARAMLRHSRITLLDEATASVDNETDDLIQRTVRESFQYSTVLTIAHRLRTILDSDKILVMNAGSCQEFGTPDHLLHQEQSYFRESCIKSGIDVPQLTQSALGEI